MSETTNHADPDDTLQCYIELMEIRRKKIALAKQEKTTRITFEAKNVDVEAVHATIMLNRKDSPSMWMHRLRRAAQIVGVLPIEEEKSGQLSMMPALPSRSAQERKAAQAAWWDGYEVATAGGELKSNPNPTGSDKYVAWRDGWTDGAKDKKDADEAKEARKAARKEDKRESANATPAPTEVRKAARKRGRKAGNGTEEHPPTE